MSLLVNIVQNPGASQVRKYLQVEDVAPSLERAVTTTPLPGDSVLQIDLKRTMWVLHIAGTAAHSLVATGNNGIANYKDLTNMRTWGGGDVIRLYYDTNTYGEGKIVKLDLRREAGKDFWTFSMAFACKEFQVGT